MSDFLQAVYLLLKCLGNLLSSCSVELKVKQSGRRQSLTWLSFMTRKHFWDNQPQSPQSGALQESMLSPDPHLLLSQPTSSLSLGFLLYIEHSFWEGLRSLKFCSLNISFPKVKGLFRDHFYNILHSRAEEQRITDNFQCWSNLNLGLKSNLLITMKSGRMSPSPFLVPWKV